MTEVADIHLDAAITAYDLLGYVAPVLWATGPGAALTATPATDEALRASGQPEASTVLASLAVAVGARFVGRVDEAWVKIAAGDTPLDDLYPGALAERAESDPTVRTAIICHALEVATGDQLLGIAVAGLDDDGERTWALDWSPPVDGARVALFAAVAAALRDSPPPGTVSRKARRRITAALEDCGWACLEP